MRNFELPGRSPVYSENGMAATSHPLATLAAIDVLREGGNALDAAVAACAVQCVVEPGSTGLGGDCFAMLSFAGELPPIAFNGSGRTPSSLDWAAVANIEGEKIRRLSPHSVTIPGAVDAWATLVADYGRKDLASLLQPAIQFAEDGYPIYQRVAYDWHMETEILRKCSATADTFLTNGMAPEAGTVHKQPNLAYTLKSIAERGRSGFYRGEIAQDMVECLQNLGGYHSLEDFECAKGGYVDAISTRYQHHDVYECPPNAQGMAALLILNILSECAEDGDPLSARRLHSEIEAIRLTYEDSDLCLCDPSTNDVDVRPFLSQARAFKLSRLIDPKKRRRSQFQVRESTSGSTVYISVVDRDRNAVSFINSIFDSFGSGITANRSGVLFNNRACGFSMDPLHPNGLAPNKRPRHTLIPAIAGKNGKTVASFGVMGGAYQAAGHAYFLRNMLNFGLDVQEAIDLPRVFPSDENNVEVEKGIPHQTRAALERRGHVLRKPVEPIGGGQAVLINWESGLLMGGSDPRKDGCALGY